MIQTKSRQLTGSIALQAEMAAFKASLATGMEEVKAKIRLITSHSLAGTPTGAVLDDAASASGKMLRPWLLLPPEGEKRPSGFAGGYGGADASGFSDP